jgi:hypothetical protein
LLKLILIVGLLVSLRWTLLSDQRELKISYGEREG